MKTIPQARWIVISLTIALAALLSGLGLLWILAKIFHHHTDVVGEHAPFLQAWIYMIQTVVLTATLVYVAPQARAAHSSIRAQMLMKVIEEWRDLKIYAAVNSIHELRGEWKKTKAFETRESLATEWVAKHAPRIPDTREQKEQDEWVKRRVAIRGEDGDACVQRLLEAPGTV